MVCEGWKGQLHAYQDGTLSPSERASVEDHLSACADCRAEWILLQGLAHALRDEPLMAPPVNLTAKVMARLPAQNRAWALSGRVFLYVGLYLLLVAGGLWGMYALGPTLGDICEDGISETVEWSTVFGQDLGDWIYDTVTSDQSRQALLAAVALLLTWVLYEISGMPYDERVPRRRRIAWVIPRR